MPEQDDEAILNDLLKSIDQLTRETREQRTEVRTLESEIEQKHECGQLTDFHYALDQERLRRFRQNIDYCLRSLDRQKKIALQKLREL